MNNLPWYYNIFNPEIFKNERKESMTDQKQHIKIPEKEVKALEEQKEGKWVNVTEAWMMEDLENQIKEGKGCLGREEE